jgi:hypothetical protein
LRDDGRDRAASYRSDPTAASLRAPRFGRSRKSASAGVTDAPRFHSTPCVAGSVVTGCIVDPNAIHWLRLVAVGSEGPGFFAKTTFIQRVNTTGGRAPAQAGAPDEVVGVPYTAEYVFYRAR